jgi:hypothetical protein
MCAGRNLESKDPRSKAICLLMKLACLSLSRADTFNLHAGSCKNGGKKRKEWESGKDNCVTESVSKSEEKIGTARCGREKLHSCE